MKRTNKLLLTALAMCMLAPQLPASAEIQYTADLTQPSGGWDGTNGGQSYLGIKNFHAGRAFDNDLTSVYYWSGGTVPAWLSYEFTQPQIIGKYRMYWQHHVNYQHYMPRDWTFEGFDEATGTWVVLDSHQGVTNWEFAKWRDFIVPNPRYFKKYKINVTKSGSSVNTGIGEVELLGVVSQIQFDIDTANANPYGGQLFDTYLVSRNAAGLNSETVTVKYDPTLYEFISAAPESGFAITSQSEPVLGELQFALTSQGAVFSATDATRMLKLTFRAKDKAATGRIETTAGQAVNTAGAQLNATLGGESIKVSVKQGDVNLDGTVTIGDLAMARKVLGQTPTGIYSRADLDGNGVVEEADLQFITNILEPITLTDGGTGYTYDLTQGGDVTASSTHLNYSYYQPRYAFDGDTTSGFYWNSGTKVPSGWLNYEFRFPQRIGKYTLLWQKHVGYEAYMPKDWTFEGYNQQTGQWDVLDSRTNESGWATGEKRTFTFDNANYYKKYRINIAASNHASYVGVGEMEMFGILERTLDLIMPGDYMDFGLVYLGTEDLKEGDTINMTMRMTRPHDIKAEEAIFEYDPALFEYHGTTARDGVKIYKEEVLAPGKIRFVLAHDIEADPDALSEYLADISFTIKTNPNVPAEDDYWYGMISIKQSAAAASNGMEMHPAPCDILYLISKR